MKGDAYFVALVLLIFTAFADRMREIQIFNGWKKEFLLRFKRNKFTMWLVGDYKLTSVKVFGVVIKLHPIFKDGYHWHKNLVVFFICLFVAYFVDFSFIFVGPFFWWVVQQIVVRVLVGKYND